MNPLLRRIHLQSRNRLSLRGYRLLHFPHLHPFRGSYITGPMRVGLTCLPTFSRLVRVLLSRTASVPLQDARKTLHILRRYNPLLIQTDGVPIPPIYALQPTRLSALPHQLTFQHVPDN